jgi:coenzyme F420-reducing hydrogenase delta subunit
MTNYTKQQTDYIVGNYAADPNMETVNILAKELGKSPKSIIGKLSREGVYKRNVYVSKTGASPITKVELVSTIAYNLGLREERLEGLEKAPKQVLFLLEKATAAGAGTE